jgi:hypothetical protein
MALLGEAMNRLSREYVAEGKTARKIPGGVFRTRPNS